MIVMPWNHIGWRGWLPRSARYLGRRGSMLMLLGICWFVVGIGTYSSDSGGSFRGEMLHETILSPEIRGTLWMLTGAVAVAFAWRPQGFNDALGWIVLYLMPSIRVLSYFLAWLDSFSWIPLGGDGYGSGWQFAIVYAVFVGVVIICSGWAEPREWPPSQSPPDPEEVS